MPTTFLSSAPRMTDFAEADLLKRSLDVCPEAAFWFGPDNKIVYVNNACCCALGYKREEMADMSLLTINPTLTDDELEQHWDILRTMGSTSGDTVCRRKNGTYFPIELISSYIKFGGVEICFGFAIDISRRKENEAALRESEERYRALFESSHDGLMLMSPRDLHIIACNKAALDIFGVKDASEMSSISLRKLSPANQPDGRDSMEKAEEMVEIAMKIGVHFFEWTLQRIGGRQFLVSVLLTKVHLATGNILQATIRDITEQKQMNRLISIHRELTRALGTATSLDAGLRLCLDAAIQASMMDCGGIYLRNDGTGTFELAFHKNLPVSFMEEVAYFKGDSFNEKNVMNCKPVYADYERFGIPWDETDHGDCIRGVAMIPFMDERHVCGCLNLVSHTLKEVPVFTRSTLESIAAHISMAIKRLQMEEGRKNAVEALRKSEERCRRLLTSITGFVFTVDIAGDQCPSIRYGEGCYAITGYHPEEFAQNKEFWIAMVIEEDRMKVTLAVKNLIREKSCVSMEHRIKRKDGAIRWLSATLVPHFDPNGELFSWDGLVSDITSNKETERAIEQHKQQLLLADKMASLGVLVSGVAHEINNPNNYLMLNAKILSKAWNEILPILDTYYAGKNAVELAGLPYGEARRLLPGIMKGMLDGTNRIKHIVDSLRSYSRTDTSQFQQNVDLNMAVESALTLVSSLVKKTTDFLSVKCDSSLPTVRGSQQQIEQVIINLLTNACHALNNRTDRIEVRTLNDEDGVILQVIDEGMGIAAENIPKITEPFFTTKRDTGGTGLGLSVSSNIVKNHGGTIAFSSEIGKGTTVTIRFPHVGQNGMSFP